MTSLYFPPGSACTCLRLRKAARRISQIYDQSLEPFGLTITQFGLLAHLHSLEGIGIGSLADQLVMDPTTLTRNLRPLIRQGFVEQTPDPDDKRSRRMRLTTDGETAYQRARPAWLEAQNYVGKTLGEEGIATLHAALDGMLGKFTS